MKAKRPSAFTHNVERTIYTSYLIRGSKGICCKTYENPLNVMLDLK